MRRLLAYSVASMAAFLSAGLGAAEPKGVQPEPSAAELVEGVIAQESQIDSVRSIYLRFTSKLTRPADAANRAIAALKKKSPAAKIDLHRDVDSNLWPEVIEEVEIAFDAHHVRRREDWRDAFKSLEIYDGKVAVRHQVYLGPSRHEQYELTNSPQDYFSHLPAELVAGIGAPFLVLRTEDDRRPRNGDGWESNGLSTRGSAEAGARLCYVLENRVALRRVYVGVDDRRLHGETWFVMDRDVDQLPLINKAAQREFGTMAEANQWLKEASAEEQQLIYKRLTVESFPLMKTLFELTLEDYRQLAPGLWCPALRTVIFPGIGGEPPMHRERRLVDAKVNQPLPASLFTIEKLKDGARVHDERGEVPIEYEQKADRTAEEFQKITDEYKRQFDRWKGISAVHDALVGQMRRSFPSRSGSIRAPGLSSP